MQLRDILQKQGLLLATRNIGKLAEMQSLLLGLDIEITALERDLPEDLEAADSFAGNALLKARAAALREDRYCLAEDSGLCVEALGGRPGIHSARYMGASAEEGIQRLLTELAGETDRRAYFVCSLQLCDPDGLSLWRHESLWQGSIAETIQGAGGFGYDPIFVPEGLDCSAGELSQAQKNTLSHRGQAFRAFVETIQMHH